MKTLIFKSSPNLVQVLEDIANNYTSLCLDRPEDDCVGDSEPPVLLDGSTMVLYDHLVTVSLAPSREGETKVQIYPNSELGCTCDDEATENLRVDQLFREFKKMAGGGLKFKCVECGREDARASAVVKWDEENQDWYISLVLDDASCDRCGDAKKESWSGGNKSKL